MVVAVEMAVLVAVAVEIMEPKELEQQIKV
jgi:hypothetical protein